MTKGKRGLAVVALAMTLAVVPCAAWADETDNAAGLLLVAEAEVSDAVESDAEDASSGAEEIEEDAAEEEPTGDLADDVAGGDGDESDAEPSFAPHWECHDSLWYYYDAEDTPRVGWLCDKNLWYYLDRTTGAMRTGWVRDKGAWYWCDLAKGFMRTGWVCDRSTWYWFDAKGRMRTGWVCDDGAWYYLDRVTGAMCTGWLELDGERYYLDPRTGAMMVGERTIDGTTYSFNDRGVEAASTVYGRRAMALVGNYSSSTDWMIFVFDADCRTVILHRENGSWRVVKDWVCSPGRPGATVHGVFHIGNRGLAFGGGSYTCYYWTQFYGAWLFHSVLYNAGTYTIQDGRLGMRISHGCVRLAIEDAKYIHDTIPTGTTVVVS